MSQEIDKWRDESGRFAPGNQYGRSRSTETVAELRREVLDALRDRLPPDTIADGMYHLFVKSVQLGSARGVSLVLAYMIGGAEVDPSDEGVDKMIELLNEYHKTQGPRTWADVNKAE